MRIRRNWNIHLTSRDLFKLRVESGIKWKSIREKVIALNPELAAVIDSVNPSDKHSFVKVNYRYGESVIVDGKLVFYGELEKYRDVLSYSDIPLGIITSKKFEIFVNNQGQVTPMRNLQPGDAFGLFETLAANFDQSIRAVWSINAGSRLVFSLARISDRIGLTDLEKYYQFERLFPLAQPLDHFQLFRAIAQSEKFEFPWEGEILFFSKPWFSMLNDKSFALFREFILSTSYLASLRILNYYQFDMFWQSFLYAFAQYRIRSSAYLNDTLKYLLAIQLGTLPGIMACNDHAQSESEDYLPLEGIQKALVEVYGLKLYQPTIMHADDARGALEPAQVYKAQYPVYYSLSLPIFLGNPEAIRYTQNTTIMTDIKLIKSMVDVAMDKMRDMRFTPKFDQLKYFHTDNDRENIISSSKELPSLDASLLSERYPHLEFCATSPFWRGAVCFLEKK